MKTYQVNDKSVVVILSPKEADALYGRTQQHTGIKKSALLKNAEYKLLLAIQYR